LVLLASACGSDPDVASVDGGGTLTQDDVDALVDEVSTDGDAATVGDQTLTGADAAVLADMPGVGVIDRIAAAGAITDWVRNELWYSSLADEGFTDVQPYLDEARRQFEEFVATTPDADVPPIDSAAGQELIRSVALGPAISAYLLDFRGVEIQWPVQLCSSHILLDTEEDALAAIARLDAGEDFADLAVELSTGPSGPTGGDLGCVDPASFVPEFVEGAAALGGPGVTPPVQTEFGWHVIEVRSFDASPSDDPAVIQDAVLSTPEFVAFQGEVVTREVTIDPRYGVWDPLSASVVPANG
jgi:parvulin-like peptidyl-prolyl isomerase